uniref:NADH-ubiquinone oxidoreductase chain 2 n=1 Tax=Iconaster longimanus TaxID=2672156 RepID=A0A7S8CUI7_9ECHI|nr:NADH dehydrogenase subunit 2 [Iconaster longimanus]QPC56394.1 NADH dehydrogenase subunit 2 [Iconaster longimanus]
MHRGILVVLVFNVVVSTVMVMSSHHWFSVWVGLEINTLSILPVLCGQFFPRSVESTVKYFLVQSLSAAMVLNVVIVQAWLYSSWCVVQPLNVFTSLVMVLAIGLKLGLFPCHYWFPDVVQGVGFIQGLMLSTWQKLAPFVVLVYVVGSVNVVFLGILGVLSVLVGGWGGLNQSQVRKVLAFSSIAHVGWIVSVLGYSVGVGCVMFFVYIILNTGVFMLGDKFSLKSLASLSRLVFINPVGGFCFLLGVLSLGGLPPLFGFVMKFLALGCLVSNGVYVVGGFLVMGSLLSLFFYLRIAFNSSLVLFPQHVLSLFVWRVSGSQGGFSLYSAVLSVFVSVNLLGLSSLSVFLAFLN